MANSSRVSGVAKSVKGMVKSSAPRSTSARSAVATSSGVPATRPPQDPNRRSAWATTSSRVGRRRREAHGALEGQAGRAGLRSQLVEAVDGVGGAVPPVGVLATSGSGQLLAGPAEVDGHGPGVRAGPTHRAPQR